MTTLLIESITVGTTVVLSKRAQNRVIKASLNSVALQWDRKFLRLHFLPSAGARYGYKARARATEQKKLRLAALGKVARGGRVDLVHSGLTEQTVVRPHFVRATPTRAIVPIITPSYIIARSRTPQRINKDREIKAIIPREETALQKTGDATLEKQSRFEADNARYKSKA